MNKILLRFRIVSNNQIVEVYLDDRLSFKDNFKMLNLNENYHIYDSNKKIFIREDLPIKEFHITRFISFDLY